MGLCHRFLDFPESVRSAMAVGDLSNMNVLKLCIEGVQVGQNAKGYSEIQVSMNRIEKTLSDPCLQSVNASCVYV